MARQGEGVYLLEMQIDYMGWVSRLQLQLIVQKWFNLVKKKLMLLIRE